MEARQKSRKKSINIAAYSKQNGIGREDCEKKGSWLREYIY